MKHPISTLSLLSSVLIISLHVDFAQSQGGGGGGVGGVQTCSGVRTRFRGPSSGFCLPWQNQRLQTKEYPDDFAGILNKADIYQCPSSGKRVIISNGIPDHEVTLQNRNAPCEVNWAVEMPLNPQLSSTRTEVPIRGMIAMAMNGVPAYGPQESDSLNAVDGNGAVPGARFWYGHAGGSVWHFHNPQMGKETPPSPETLLGYAMDGFPIYGSLDDADLGKLDACNGYVNDQGNYQYHVRAISQVDSSLEYCNGNSPNTNWNYILGCYSGSVANSGVFDSTSYILDSDCFLDPNPVFGNTGSNPTDTPVATPTDSPVSGPTSSTAPNGVNIIIMQPDDLLFFDEWGAPPNNPTQANRNTNMPNVGMPNIERLRMDGLQMMEAYTASPMCGTSRYSTITGKYPSRAETNSGNPSSVTIPTTKLQGEDCSRENLAAEFKANGYRTAMIGKWHLSRISDSEYTYDGAVETVKQCGFDEVAGLYVENLVANPNNFNNYADGTFSHNMEWITHEAIKIINEDSDKPFFMYYNPTVPHGSNSISMALNDFTCRDTAAGTMAFDPMIPGMTEEYGNCADYRQSIIDRSNSEDDYGPIWLDDAVGAILKALESKGILDNTIFLFQMDHGMDVKGGIVEGGIRIPQFIHYPAGISGGTKLNVPVSTIDIGATMFDFAGITPSYTLDGYSWKKALESSSHEAYLKDGRCLFFEIERDRAVRCGCYKYMSIFDINDSTTVTRGSRRGLDVDDTNLYDLCGGTTDYVSAKYDNQEALNILDSDPSNSNAATLRTALGCHLERTDGQNFGFQDCNLSDAPPDDEPVSSPTESPERNETPGPTPSPTAGPTPNPTPGPTPNPTPNPTPGPTPDPTPNPTRGPTFSPVADPTPFPTPRPTPSPTERVTTGAPVNSGVPPTPGPTPNPIPAPTPGPMSSPTSSEAPISAPVTDVPLINPTAPPSTAQPTPMTTVGNGINTLRPTRPPRDEDSAGATMGLYTSFVSVLVVTLGLLSTTVV